MFWVRKGSILRTQNKFCKGKADQSNRFFFFFFLGGGGGVYTFVYIPIIQNKICSPEEFESRRFDCIQQKKG